MTHGHTSIPTKGCCIYCGNSHATLTDEHIVPLSLGGQHIIRKASCLSCADITKRFEQDVARGLWGNARTSYNAPSRRKKDRKKDVRLHPVRDLDSVLVVPTSEYPAPLVFYKMFRAGILQGASPEEDSSSRWTLIAIADELRLRAFETQHPGRLTAQFRHVPTSYARLLAKIGYGQVLCSLHPNEFNPICLPYILGQKKNLSYIVGDRPTFETPQPSAGYRLSSHRVGTADRLLILAEIRLFANNQTPTYHVVVGDVTGAERVAAVKGKLAATCAVDLPEAAVIPDNLSDEFHWMPTKWPPEEASFRA